MRATPLFLRRDDRRAAAKIDLGFFARFALHSAEREFKLRRQTTDEAKHAVIAAGEAVLGDEILMDAFGVQAEVDLATDRFPPRLAAAGPTRRLFGLSWRALRRLGSGVGEGRVGGVGNCRRAGGRIGWF